MRWPDAPERFTLSRLAKISGADVSTIKRWQHRGSLDVWRVGRGTDRAYSLSDALHVAVVAEMARLGMGITGKGADLSRAVCEWIEYRLRRDPDISRLAPVALVPIPGEDDFAMVEDVPRAVEDGSCIVMSVRRIAEGVALRHRAASS